MYYEIKAAKARKKIFLNITPLIDVIFLLLIFFLVSSTFLEQPSMMIELPSAKTAEPHRIEQYVIVVGQYSTIFVNDTPYTKEELFSRLSEIAAKDKNSHIVLRADQRAPYGTIIEVIDTVRQCGLTKIIALTEVEA